ncbi:phosphoglycerate mutase-like protein [Mycena pura]|uniref:Phosphoglycerate mutase-like protein n=1 Tax=Mycena pura TaxID=153505 RepID=A0AAD6VHA2_9AGAR|nr:phosphoglycerate mutase-like protein [Mycena pura]
MSECAETKPKQTEISRMSRDLATFTFVRHGESTDNLRSVWAGWADSTLTNHAQAVAAALSATQFTAILSSPLKRAYMTAQEVHKQQVGSPPLSTSPMLRERHFGVAEGKPSTSKTDPNISLAEHYKRGVYPALPSRKQKFPEGESLDEVQDRARQVWADVLLHYVRQAASDEYHGQVHVVVVSHGIFIKEALRALVKYDSTVDTTLCDSQWLRNTGWARVVIGIKGDEPISSQDSLPPLRVQLTHFNQCDHLTSVKRQRGGIGRESYDARQKDIRRFFDEGRKAKSFRETQSEGKSKQ